MLHAMRRKRHSRAFWEKVVGAIESGEASVDQVAHRYGARKATVRWWCSQLRGRPRGASLELVPVHVAPVERGTVRVVYGDVAVEIDARTSLEDVAVLVRALRS